MKRKIGIIALLLVLFPLLTLVGCKKPASFYFEAVSSWTGITENSGGGTVTGTGSYQSGKTVTLTATAKPNSRFIAWVFEDSLLITDNSTFTVKNTGSANAVTRSELSFKSSSNLKGKYTAIFDDEKIIYTMLTSWRVTDDYTLAGEDSQTSATPVTMTADIFITQGIGTSVYQATGYDVKNNVINKTEDITRVFKLSAEEPQDLSVVFTIGYGREPFSYRMMAEIEFGTNTSSRENEDGFIPSADNKYSYKVNFTANGTYETIFKFTYNDADKYLVVEYSNLNKIF